jgi:hypothetical protein
MPARPPTDGLMSMAARRLVPHSAEHVYAFIARLENHWHLNDRYLRLEHLSADRRAGRIAIRSPLGLRRTARTNVTTAHEPVRFGGTAAIGRQTTARVHWNITPHEHGATVTLEATVLAAAPLDRLLLTLGGRRWLRRRFHHVLDRLANTLEPATADALS